MNDLPVEILSSIFYHLSLNELVSLRLVNRRFKEVIESDSKLITHVYIGPQFLYPLLDCPSYEYVPFFLNIRENAKVPLGLWNYLGNHCGPSINIYSHFYINENLMFPIASKFETIVYVGPSYMSRTRLLELTEKFDQLQHIRSLNSSESCSFQGWNDSIITNRIIKGLELVHLSLPIYDETGCFTGKQLVSSSTKCLTVDFGRKLTIKMKRKPKSSMLELDFQFKSSHDYDENKNYLNFTKHKMDFTLLRKLTIYFTSVKPKFLYPTLSGVFETAFDSLKFLSISMFLTDIESSEMENFVSSFKNLVHFELEVTSSKIGSLNLTPPKLKKLKLKSYSCLTVNVNSNNLKDLQINNKYGEDSFFNNCFTSLITFSSHNSIVSLGMLLSLTRATNLRSISFVGCHLDEKSTAYFISEWLTNFTYLRTIGIEFIHSATYNWKGLSIKIDKFTFLESLSINCRMILILSDQFQEIQYVKRCNGYTNFNLIYTDGRECKVAFAHSFGLKLIVKEQLHNLVRVSFQQVEEVQASMNFLKKLLKILKQKCPEVLTVTFASGCAYLLSKKCFKKRLLNWVKSMDKLKNFTAPCDDFFFAEIRNSCQNHQVELRAPSANE